MIELPTEPGNLQRPIWQRPGGVPDTDPYGPDAVAVYRLFNVPGALLYVGISDHPKRRFEEHFGDKQWRHAVASWAVEWLPDRAAALAEEAQAIVDEVPAYNIRGVPAVIENPTAGWVATFQRRRPCKADLDALFLAVVRLRSLGHDSAAHRAWTEREALDTYVCAKGGARRIDVHDHQRFINRWNREQEAASYAHLREPMPPSLPAWPRVEGVAERIGMWLLGRSVERPRRRFQSPAEMENRERALETKVRCTVTDVLISVCDCRSRHIVDEDGESKFGLPLGHPHGKPISRRVSTAGAA